MIDDLEKQKGLFVRVPCGCEFAISRARLFDATKPLPPDALEELQRRRNEVAEAKAELADRKNRVRAAKVTARAVNIGKVVEKIAPSLAGFPVRSDECRSLFEPIDYVVFRGLSSGKIEALEFVEVKSGNARLNVAQKDIRSAVEAGKVHLRVAPASDEEAA